MKSLLELKKIGLALVVFAVMAAAPRAAEAPRQMLLDPAAAGAAQQVKSDNSPEIKINADPAVPGIVVTIPPGKSSYPGVNIKPASGAAWDLSAFGHVDARVTNLGAGPLKIALRVDNAGNWQDNPFNTESITLKPGESGTITTIFGFSYGRQPGYALKPGAVVNLLMFALKAAGPQSFRIDWIAAAGPAGEKPPVDPKTIRVKPAGGMLFGPGANLTDAAKQIEALGVKAALTQTNQPALRIDFDNARARQQLAKLKPAAGRWDLREYLEIRLRLRNAGTAPLTPRVRIESDKGATEWQAADAPLAPGAAAEMVIPFINPVPWQGIKGSGDRTSWNGEKGTGNQVANDAVGAVVLTATRPAPGTALEVEWIRAGLPPAPALPDWLGKRPPVEGEWVKTFDDEFDGSAIDETKWAISGPNYWDKTSHWSKKNVIVGGGVVRMRYEKKTGPQNDDPTQKSSAYASGLLETYGKWTQRYGYFEARMKLPTAPGLWPAFWMMPDRGAAAGAQGKRQDTANGGMEFDIMEHLTRWGGLRYNIAMHWDSYAQGKHKQTGTERIYVQPDKDGFITAGLLWLPGLAVYYGNGREVGRWEDPRISNVPSDMMFTLPTGGWDNSRLEDAKLPDDFTIDYVRAWQRRDLAQ